MKFGGRQGNLIDDEKWQKKESCKNEFGRHGKAESYAQAAFDYDVHIFLLLRFFNSIPVSLDFDEFL